MSDEQPAQRKVGSLRDRIAQFETKPAAPPSVPPKPVVPQKKWAWKDKQAEAPAHPPPPPAASASSPSPAQDAAPAPERDSWSDVSTHQDVPAKSTPAPAPAFSAADAASSIAAGGGLKARLAALQGSGFGSTPETSNAPPPPPAGKPRVWKKAIVTYEAPPKPERPRPAEDENPETEEERHHDHHDDEHEAHTHPETAEEGEAEAAAPEEPKDPEEEERQRRAAIAARMARLGGARVGMGMPVFGMKPPVPAPIRKDSGTDTEATPAPARQASASPPVPKREPSFEEPSESVRDSVAETEMTNEEETTTEATESKEDVSHHEVLPTPASPPRPRPPIPVARAWSNSPPASPKKRPEVISQGSSFSVPRSVYEYPSRIYPVVARASGGIAVADHLRNNRSPSPIMSSPLSLSPTGSPTESESAEQDFPPQHHATPIPRQQPSLSHRHSDSALRSSMISDSGPSLYSSNRVTRFYEPQGFFGPSLFVSNQMATGLPNSLSSNASHSTSPPPMPSHSRVPPSNNLYTSKPATNTEDLNSVSREPLHGRSDEQKPVSRLSRSGSSSSFYPRPLSRSATPPVPKKETSDSINSSSSSTRIRFKLLGWLSKKRRLTESSLPPSSLHDNTSVSSGSSMTPAARIKTKYQMAAASSGGPTPTSNPPTHRRMPTAPEPIRHPTYDTSNVVSVNSPIDEYAPAPPPKSNTNTSKSKIPPPRPPRPGSPASARSANTSDSDAASTSSRPRRLQRQNVLRASPGAPFSTRKPSIGNDGSDVGSMLTRSGSMRSNSSDMAQIHTLLPPNHQPASNTLKHARGSLPFPLPLPDGSGSHVDLATPVSNANGMTCAAVEEVEGSREGKEVGGGDEKEGPSQGHQKGLKDEGEGEKDEGSEKKKPSPDAPVPTALALALQIDKPEPVLEVTTSPPSIPTSARPTSASPASASSGKPLPPMPKRAPPPRRKMPTPKVSSEAVPTVTSPPVPELPAHPEDEKPKEDVEAKPDAVEKAPVEEKVVAPPAETGAGHEPAPVEADTAVSDPVEPAHDKDDSLSKEVKKEAPAEVRGSEELGATGGEEKKVDDEKPIESSKPVEKATGGEFHGPAKSVDTKKGKRRASQQSTPSRSASISVSQPPRGLHEVSPRASSDRPRQAEASPARVESPQPDEAAKESERKQQLAQRMAKLGGVGIPGQRPTPVRKPSKQASEVQSPPAESGSVVSRNVTATPPPKEPDTSRRTSLPPKRRTLPPPPLPLTTEPTSIEPEASQVEDVSSTGPPVSSPAPPPLSAYPRPKRVSLPPSRLPPPPPTAPIQGSFAPQRQDSKDSQKPPIRKDSKPQAVSAPPSRILAHEIVQSSLPVKAEPQDEVEHVDDGKLHPPEREIMYDADTDPIDPSFYSPMRSPARLPYLEPESEEEEEAHEEVPPAEPTPPVEDEAAARKKTLAERMAKLGGIALGAPGPGGIPPRRPTQKADSVSKPEPSEDVAHEDPQGDADESEDAARARRAAIAARLAAGGGIKFGMMPGAKPPQPPVVQKPAEPEVEEGAHSDHEGLHGEPEEEQEEEDEDEAQDIEAPPPPPPPRTPRVLPPTPSIGASDPSVPPPLPPGRHVRPSASVPSTPLPRTPMFNIPPPPPPMSAIEPHRNDRHWQKPDEAIEEESDHSLPPPPPPPPPPPAPPIKLGRPQHGKRPSVSAIETAPAEPEAPPPPPAESSPIEVPGPDPATIGPAEHYTPTELQSIWQRVGLQVVSAAKVAAERSKKMVIADGTPGGFVEAALAAVPSARPISMINRYYGYPIYSQAGPHVEKKECEIMPGDIVALTDVKLKGFKGLQSYHLHIGTSGGPLLAIVQEYEGGKKHKLKVYQAALQSNTFPSVETTSYRLDDLKSGTIQVFRVEEQ
ncbi:hypothetical protein FRB90_002159 [Tulasnella sp. 427]|nr:hypothetical protein FRB90_002159 [Tulasnella sp. 427]